MKENLTKAIGKDLKGENVYKRTLRPLMKM